MLEITQFNTFDEVKRKNTPSVGAAVVAAILLLTALVLIIAIRLRRRATALVPIIATLQITLHRATAPVLITATRLATQLLRMEATVQVVTMVTEAEADASPSITAPITCPWIIFRRMGEKGV